MWLLGSPRTWRGRGRGPTFSGLATRRGDGSLGAVGGHNRGGSGGRGAADGVVDDVVKAETLYVRDGGRSKADGRAKPEF